MKTYQVIGLMSGSSLDGLDIVFCRFDFEGQDDSIKLAQWKLLLSDTFPFSNAWKQRLCNLQNGNASDIMQAHADLGRYIGNAVNSFVQEHKILKSDVHIIASHGHTLFHEPSLRFTTQIGDGAAIAATTGITAVCDFRSTDIALGGQGAPLAPLADRFLFPGYDYYLNLGGISNVTAALSDKHVAFDVSGANQMLNALAGLEGLAYDKDGELAAAGKIIPALYEELNQSDFFAAAYPKSLSNQWVQQNSTKSCLLAEGSVSDRLHTCCHHIAFQLSKSLAMVEEKEGFVKNNYTMFTTGGGALNKFLMTTIGAYLPEVEIVIPEAAIVESKEGLLMALMGVLRIEGIPNCISTVTGASRNAIGGAVYLA